MNLHFSIHRHQIKSSHSQTFLQEIWMSVAGIIYGIFRIFRVFKCDFSGNIHRNGAKSLSAIFAENIIFIINLVVNASELLQPKLSTLLDRITHYPSERYRNISKCLFEEQEVVSSILTQEAWCLVAQ